MLSRPNKQDGPALVSYVLGRGYRWANNTSVNDALTLVGGGEHLHERLGPALRRFLLLRRRVGGDGFSVADVERARWWSRQVDTWDEVIAPMTVVPWPGSTAWRDLRFAHLAGQGWTDSEIAGLLRLPVRAVRVRLDCLSRTLPWQVVSPVPPRGGL
jgi:hypothetical protein